MNRMRPVLRHSAALLVFVLLSPFRAEGALPALLGPSQAIDRDPSPTTRLNLDPGPLATAPRVSATFGPGLDLVLSLDQRVARGPQDFSWFGRVEGQAQGSVLLVVRDGRVTGTIRTADRVLSLRPNADGSHELREIPVSSFPPCETPDGGTIEAPDLPDSPPQAEDDGSVIDVLVVYTDDVAANETDPAAVVQLVIDETNQIYELSGIDTRLRLVAAEEIDYAEPGNSADSLDELRSTDDGVIDQVHDLRDLCGADVVSMWLDDLGGSCGRASIMTNPGPGFERFAFSVVSWWCAENNFSFAHELGHNQGCSHDRANGGGAAADYAYGYSLNGEFRTVMAYNCDDNCPRRGHISNPDVNYMGMPTGIPLSDPEPAFNARNINETANVVANFRQSKAGCCEPDGFEGAEGCENGFFLAGGDAQDRNHCSSEEDWIRFFACAGETYSIEVSEQEADSLVAIELYGPDCASVEASEDAGGTGRGARLEWTVPTSGTYSARLLSLSGDGAARGYRVSLIGNTPPNPGDCCQADAYEVLDDCDDAALLLGGQERSGNHCDDNEDWLSFTACAGREYLMEVRGQEALSDIVLELIGPDCALLLTSDNAEGSGLNPSIRWRAAESGRHRVRIASNTGNGGNRAYSLELIGDTTPCEPSALGTAWPLRMERSDGRTTVRFENVSDETGYQFIQGSLLDWYGSPDSLCLADWDDLGQRVFLDWDHLPGQRWLVVAATNQSGDSPSGQDSLGQARADAPAWPRCP